MRPVLCPCNIFSRPCFVVMQLGFCLILMCCQLLPFLGFLPPTPFFPSWAGGGDVQCIYL